ncbi:60S ribosomal protein L4 [Anaeramoeba flamelloides]|uniref:60S ribosomal protein L4 n=1 Tax=Anaeramoeba flamelloides TaxID=1746091 RepID=A0AAV7ZZR8_9EUKA|nr:60S ribosomal protein L4 [Anaeramoeba flamelloides]KAJ3447488.1 60S ribosomal protein L4 [Anaeramoeba flamelloides]KAJ3452889.1 60S ribosomal protein L4 [Anaeramoeba flamelloides]KAJ6236147.1 60S ribosomal protein L4 [Anaeramoeba flamelloides]KAJ6237181.1 60S ribosomal protein L4 [Anaeramoeba flamelloides]
MTTQQLRPIVSVFPIKGKVKTIKQVPLPSVFSAPIRPDVVRFVHTNMAKNNRQAHAVSTTAGEQTSATSWGTGRAVARIPRVKGSGTGRSGQAAFGNMCRGGRMYAPKKVWRKWHRKINTNQKRYAVCSAIAATAVTPLVMSRGHRVNKLPELPLVVSDQLQSLTKTRQAVKFLKFIGAYRDVEKVIRTKKTRVGQGKYRNRRHVLRKGPMVVYARNLGIKKAFRNIPGVETASVYTLNLLKLAPGSQMGRFIIWTESAFKLLEDIYGSWEKPSKFKSGFYLPRPVMVNTDVERIIKSDQVQTVLRNRRPRSRKYGKKIQRADPYEDMSVMVKLNPYYKTKLQKQKELEEKNKKERKEIVDKSRKEYEDWLYFSEEEEEEEEEGSDEDREIEVLSDEN